MMPDFRGLNYYQDLLIKSLEKEKIKIFFPNKNYEYLPIFRSSLKTGIKLLHINWIQEFTGTRYRNFFFNIFKLLLFKIDIYLVKYLLKIKIVWTMHNLYAHEYFYFLTEKLGRKFLLKKVNAIIIHCYKVLTYIRKEFKDYSHKIYIIPHGNYFNCYENDISSIEARKILKLKENDLVFLFFGRIRPYKGIFNLINTFKSFEINKNLKLLIIGNPKNENTKNKILRIIQTSKNIIGELKFIPDEEIQIFMNASDIVVFPYHEILASGALHLAMTYGKPIIAPRIGCIPETLNKNGAFLYNLKDKKGLGKALEKAIKNRERLKKMGIFNLEISKKLDWNKIGLETKKIYKKLFKN